MSCFNKPPLAAAYADSTCEVCTAGTYQNLDKATSYKCKTCSKDQAAEDATTACTSCVGGRYQEKDIATQCFVPNTTIIESLVDQIVSALDDDEHTDEHVQSLLNAHRLFMSFHKDGTLAAGRRYKRIPKSISSAMNPALASYQLWIAGQYRLFLTACLEWLHFDDHSRCQVTALRCLLKHCAPPFLFLSHF